MKRYRSADVLNKKTAVSKKHLSGGASQPDSQRWKSTDQANGNHTQHGVAF